MTVHDFQAKTIDGENVSLAQYKGDVLLIVNVASQCGYTPQYKGLEELYEKYRDRGFTVLGFPSNQFGRQEPESESDIKNFCVLNYGVGFPLFAKIDVNGPNAHPLYRFLTTEKRGVFGTKGIKWNFTKFLVDRDGHPLKRYGTRTVPAAIEADIEGIIG